MPWATHTLQWAGQWAANPRGGAIPKTCSWFGSQSATRLREAGVASNRRSAHGGECVLGPRTACPSPPERPLCSKAVLTPTVPGWPGREEAAEGGGGPSGRRRSMVAVRERAADISAPTRGCPAARSLLASASGRGDDRDQIVPLAGAGTLKHPEISDASGRAPYQPKSDHGCSSSSSTACSGFDENERWVRAVKRRKGAR